jgi:hypothetical protein
MLGFQLKYKESTFTGTEFIGHGNGSVIELTLTTNQGTQSVVVAPAIACEITRVNIEDPQVDGGDIPQRPITSEPANLSTV